MHLHSLLYKMGSSVIDPLTTTHLMEVHELLNTTMEIPLQQNIFCKHLLLKFENYDSWVALQLQVVGILCMSSLQNKRTYFFMELRTLTKTLTFGNLSSMMIEEIWVDEYNHIG